MLDRWLGPESTPYFRERDLREVIALHAAASESDVDRAEAQGALNFLALDDLPVHHEGQPLNPDSVVALGDGGSTQGFVLDIGQVSGDPVTGADAGAGLPVLRHPFWAGPR